MAKKTISIRKNITRFTGNNYQSPSSLNYSENLKVITSHGGKIQRSEDTLSLFGLNYIHSSDSTSVIVRLRDTFHTTIPDARIVNVQYFKDDTVVKIYNHGSKIVVKTCDRSKTVDKGQFCIISPSGIKVGKNDSPALDTLWLQGKYEVDGAPLHEALKYIAHAYCYELKCEPFEDTDLLYEIDFKEFGITQVLDEIKSLYANRPDEFSYTITGDTINIIRKFKTTTSFKKLSSSLNLIQ